MRKTLIAITAAAALTVGAVSAPQPAEARGGALAAGVIGGLAAGAIIGSAAYGPYGYYGGPAYYGPGYGYAYAPGPCYWQRQRVWDGFGWRVHRVRVCG
jgi:hypothetical protein